MNNNYSIENLNCERLCKNNQINYEDEILDLRIYIKNFVFSNWKCLDFKVFNEDIIIENDDEEEDYINDEEIFYKGILYI